MSTGVWIAFVIACSTGAVVRYCVDGIIGSNDTFALGTFWINVSGSLILGVLTGLALYHGLDDDVRVVAGTGFCGAYTTFSAFALETVRMVERRTYRAATRYALLTLVACLAAAAIGLTATAF